MVLEGLTNSEKCNLAQNPNTPPETLTRLSDDEDNWVQWEVEENPNTPQYIKEYLDAVEFMRDCYES